MEMFCIGTKALVLICQLSFLVDLLKQLWHSFLTSSSTFSLANTPSSKKYSLTSHKACESMGVNKGERLRQPV